MENEKNKVNESAGGAMNGLEKMMDALSKYGPIKMIYGICMLVFFSFAAYVATNPGMVFDRYTQYVTEKHSASIDYRMETAPIVRSYLNQLALETGAERAYILEFHNGKSNPSGLQWQFGDLTFINDGTDDISDEIQNVSLSRYNFANVVYECGCWTGSIDDLVTIDERFYNRMRLNGGQYFAFQMLYGANMREIAILGISFIEVPDGLNKDQLSRIMHKYGTTISPLLDEENVKAKKL